MDLGTVEDVVVAGSRADLPPGSTDTAVIAGGTWLLSERQDHLRKLVDITTMGWDPLTITDRGLDIASTCTIETLSRASVHPSWTASVLFPQCASALLASFKIWKTATVGGNICMALPAGAMISLTAALDGVAAVWSGRGPEYDYRMRIDDLVLGPQRTALGIGDVLRSIDIPLHALQSRTALRKSALSPLGRSAALVIGRVDPDGAFVLTVSAATVRPYVLRFDAVPSAAELSTRLADAIPGDGWYDDPHGAPDWRRHISTVAAQDIREELS